MVIFIYPTYRSFSCSFRASWFWAFSCLSLSSFSRAARRNCSKLSLEERTEEAGVDWDLWARLAQEPMFFNFTSWKKRHNHERVVSLQHGWSFQRLAPRHTWIFLGAMGVLGSCLILLSCWGGAARSERRGPGRGPSNVFRCLLSGLCKSWRRAGLKGDGGKTGEWEGFSSLTPTTLDLCSYRNTHVYIA